MTRFRGSASVSDPSRPDSYSGRHRSEARNSAPEPPRKKPLAKVKTKQKRRRSLPLWQELPLLVLLAFGIALLVRTFLLQAFLIPTGSMENTLAIQDRVLVNKVVYQLRDPRRGEIVVFRGADSWAPENRPPRSSGFLANTSRTIGGFVGLAEPGEKDFVKRVIGVPGDRVECCDNKGRVLINGHPLDEPYVFENNPPEQRNFGPIIVPRGRLFVLGDHRGLSQDSRAYIRDKWSGTVAIDDVIGRAFLTVWPVSRWGSLQTPPTFSQVPPYGVNTVPTSKSDGRTVTPSHAVGGVVIVAVSVRRRRSTGRRLRW